jgi:hypothetical protein
MGFLCLTASTAMAVAQSAAPSFTPEALAAARASAEQAQKSWLALAPGLDAKLAPLLPCDPAARKSIQDVSRASDARNLALQAYLRLTAAQAAEQTLGARKILGAEEARTPDANEERTDAALDRAAIEAQTAKLVPSANARPALGGAWTTLSQIHDSAARRATLADQDAQARDRGVVALRELVAAHQAREAALKQEIDAFQAEATRWNTYYTVRLSRAQAECSAIGGGPASAPSPPARPAAKGKKK